MTLALMAVRQEVNNFESSVVVQEQEFAMNLALYGLLLSLGNQYIVGSLSWRSLTSTKKSLGISFKGYKLQTSHLWMSLRKHL